MKTMKPSMTNPLIALLAVVALLLATLAMVAGTANAVVAVPAADILNVDFAGGAPVDHANGRTAQVDGTPSYGTDTTINHTVATFDGTSDVWYDLTDAWNASLTPNITGAMTTECRFEISTSVSLGTNPEYDLCSGKQTDGYGLYVSSNSSTLRFDAESGGTNYNPGTTIQTGVWYDAVGIFDGSTSYLYVNGTLAGSKPGLTGPITQSITAAQRWFLGADVNGTGAAASNTPVSIANARIWSSALSADQVAALAVSDPGSTVTPPSGGGSTGTPVAAAGGVSVPSGNIVNVDYGTGTPTDVAQGLTVSTYGTPTYATDPRLNKTVATFSGASQAYGYDMSQQWSKFSQTTGLTFECVLRYNGSALPSTKQGLCSNAQSGGAIIEANGGQIDFAIDIAGTYKYVYSPLTTNAWHDLVATWDGSIARLYVDGVLAGTTAASGALTVPDAAAQSFVVGADSAPGGIETPAPISVASAQVWNSALNGPQALTLAKRRGLYTAVVPPAADILSVDYTSGSAADTAQSLKETTQNGAAIAADAALGKPVASFNGTSQAMMYDFTSQWTKLTGSATGVSVGCRFRYNGALPTDGKQHAMCSDTQSGGVDMLIDSAGNCGYNGALGVAIYLGGAYKYACSSVHIQPDQWYDATVVYNKGVSATLYLDGAPVGYVASTGAFTGPSAAGAQHFTVGGDANATAPSATAGSELWSKISVSSVKVWDSALTPAQVAGGSAGNFVNLGTDPNGTATSSASSALTGEKVTLAATPGTGYHLAGWSTVPADLVGGDNTFTMPNAPVDVTPQFSSAAYTIHYDANGGTGSMTDQAASYGVNVALEANAFVNGAQSFDGWATTPGGPSTYQDGDTVKNLSSTDGATVTLYAQWLPAGQHHLVVTAGAHGTASGSATTPTAGDTITLAETPDVGYHFGGWQVTKPSDGSVVVAADGTFTMPDQDVAAKATFVANGYTIHFDGNGAGEGSVPDQTLVYDVSAALASNAFLRDGYDFAGWNTAADGSGTTYLDGATVKSLTATDQATVTLYAQWQPIAVKAGSWPSLPGGFVTDTFKLPGVPVSGAVSQPLLGLWNGAAPSFTKVSGDTWLDVSSTGVVTGTAPSTAPQNGGVIVVSATSGTTTTSITVEVPVLASGVAPQLQAASWNAWQDGASVTDAVGKNLAVIAAQGIDVIGFQDGGARMAQQVAEALGWSEYASGALGIVSAYPLTSAPRVDTSSGTPAIAATVSVNGQDVRVWNTRLDESDASVRDAQAAAVLAEMQGDLAGATPVVLLGDLASSSEAHVFTDAGLSDSFRVAHPDAAADPGDTLLFVTPSDRVDYVDFLGGALHVQESHTLTVGWPSATSPAGNSWASDHAAAVTVFTVGDGSMTAPDGAPAVTVGHDTVAYQVNAGPTDAQAFLGDVQATSDPSDATLSADLSGVSFDKPGWYSVPVTATKGGYVSNPVAVTVRVAPVPTLTLGSTTATFHDGDTLDEAAVLAQLQPVLDVDGVEHVDVSGVHTAGGSYPVVVTATDIWGFTVSAPATVVVDSTHGDFTGVVTSGGSPVAGACVYLYPGDPAAGATYAWCTAADGSFDIPGVAFGSYTVGVADPSGANLTWWSAAPVSFGSGSAPLAIAMTPATTEMVSGTVSDASGPVSGACVYLYAASSGPASYATCTGADGSYWIGGVATSGSYRVAVSDPSGVHQTQWWTGTSGGAGTYAAATALTNAPGATITASLTLAAAANGSVAGTVTGSGGTPVGGACVYLYAHGDTAAAKYATCAQADGTYWIGGIAAGVYDVAFFDPSGTYATKWDTTVTVTHTTVSGTDAQLTPVSAG